MAATRRTTKTRKTAGRRTATPARRRSPAKPAVRRSHTKTVRRRVTTRTRRSTRPTTRRQTIALPGGISVSTCGGPKRGGWSLPGGYTVGR